MGSREQFEVRVRSINGHASNRRPIDDKRNLDGFGAPPARSVGISALRGLTRFTSTGNVKLVIVLAKLNSGAPDQVTVAVP